MRKAAFTPAALAAVLFLSGCEPPVENYIRPDMITDFATLYSENCSGCHGADGKGGAAQPLNDAVFQHLIPKEQLRMNIANGVPGTPMFGFSKAAGGFLTENQITVLTDTMQQKWGGNAGQVADMPPYSVEGASGDAERGAAAFNTYCSSCHGPNGTGKKAAGSVIDPNYLTLVSDQSLRTTTILGRSDLHIPDWRSYVPGHPMSPQEITDVVTWIASHRPPANGTAAAKPVHPKENP